MKINLIAIGTRMPNWVDTAYEDYAKRLPTECQLNLIALEMPKRTKNTNSQKLIEQETQLIFNSIPKSNLIIAMDPRGKQFDTVELATQLHNWLGSGQDLSLLVGGPDGLSSACLERAKMHWSLSKLTLPHPMVRVIIAEQIYRAWSILSHHPYHRDSR